MEKYVEASKKAQEETKKLNDLQNKGVTSGEEYENQKKAIEEATDAQKIARDKYQESESALVDLNTATITEGEALEKKAVAMGADKKQTDAAIEATKAAGEAAGKSEAAVVKYTNATKDGAQNLINFRFSV